MNFKLAKQPWSGVALQHQANIYSVTSRPVTRLDNVYRYLKQVTLIARYGRLMIQGNMTEYAV